MDIFMLFVLLATWFRFLMLLLANRMISNLFYILLGLLKEIVMYLLLLASYLLIVASVFTALYFDHNPEKFGKMTKSFRTLFDAMLASYNYEINDG